MLFVNDTNHANYHLFQNIMLQNAFINMGRSPFLTDLSFCECIDWKKHYLPSKHVCCHEKN